MAKDKTYNKVQLDVKFTQASTRANLTSEENISVAFGKMSKWYEALVPTGGSSGQFLAWNSNGTAKWVSNPNSDTKVNVTLATTSKAFLLGTTTTPTSTAAGVTSVADTGVYLGTTAGSLYATSFYENGTALSSKYAAIGHTHGLLNSSFIQYADENNSKTGWSILGIDETVNGYILKSFRDNTTNTDWMSGGYGSGIVFGGGDTKGVISMRYNSPIITFAAGNHNSTNTGPDWYIKITGTSGNTYNFNNYMGAVKIGNYYGMAWPDGTDKGDNTWIRTTRLGLIPYAANTDATDGNVSSLGTSTWTFGSGYINNLYYKDLKNVAVVAGNTANNGIDKMTGSFFFSGNNLIGGINDWVGIQAGSSVDKWQVVGCGGSRLLYRQNDSGGTDSDNWGKWNGLMSPDSVIGNNGISITKLTYYYGTDDVDVGVYIGHTNSVTAQTDYNKPYVKYDTEGHITESSHFVHLATGTGGVAGWIKLATMKHTRTYDNTPIELTIAQRGSQLTYRLHISFKNANSTDPDINKFIIAVDDDEFASRAYMIKTDTSTWDLYIRKVDTWEALAVTRFSVGRYFTDHMEWTWKDEQVAESEITDGVEATRYLITHFRQSDTPTENYRPIVMGATQSNDTSRLNATITGQGYVSNSVFVKPSNGYLYANVFSTSSYLNDTGAQLTHYGLYLKSYLKRADNTEYSYTRYGIRTYDGKTADNSGMLLTIDSGGLTIVGGGESAVGLANLISTDQSVEGASKLNLGGTLNTSLTGSSEYLILASDGPISFVTNCNAISDRKPVMLDSLTQFYPGTTLTGSIGTSSYYWNDAYFNNLYLSNQAYVKKSSGDTYYSAERTDTGTRVSFGIGGAGVNHGIYSYTLHGWIVNGDASNVYIRSTLYNPSTTTDYFAIPFFGATPSTGAKAIYNNNGLRYSTREGTTSQPGIARLIIGNGVASTSDANKEGIIRIYSVENGFVDLLAEASANGNTLKFPALTGTLRIQRNALQYDNSSDFASYSWHKFAEVTNNSANGDRYITFLVSRTYRGNVIGILTAHIRTTGTKVFSSAEFEWALANEGIEPSNFVMVYTNTANTSCKVELWYKQEAQYDGWIFEVLKENTRVAIDHDDWTLYSTVGHGSATYTSGTGTIVSKLGSIHAATFYENGNTLSSKYGLNNQIYSLNTTSDTSTFNGAETLITSLPSSSGTGTPSYQRVTVSKFASVMSEMRTPLLYDNSAATTGTNNIIISGSASDYTSFTITLGLNEMAKRYTITIPSGIGVYNFPLIWGGAPTPTGGACHITSAFVQISEATGGLRLIVNTNSLVATMNSDGFSVASNSLVLYFVTVVGHKK